MSEKIRVVGIIASKQGATIITEQGSSIELKATDYRTHDVIAQITPIIARHQVAELDLETFDVAKAIEKKTEGKVRFFRVALDKVKSLFGRKADREIGESHADGFVSAPVKNEKAIQPGVGTLSEDQIEKIAAVDQPVGTPNTTLVAVVDNTPIIGAEALEAQMTAAATSPGRPVGFEKFMSRLAAVARERKHTAQELLKFLEIADLPIADDGSIIGYKALKVVEKEGKRVFYDHHTGKVPQVVGSKVTMPVEKVDDNRRVLCSNGLHIARRKYLTGYGSCGIVTLVKVAPEDVISVPFGEPDKMRAAAYHIVAELPAEAHAFIRSNQPMTQNEVASTLLGNVIKGNHIGVTEIVEILGAAGTNIKVTKIGEHVEPEKLVDETIKAKVLDDEKAAALDPSKLNAEVNKIIEEEAAKVEEAPVEVEAPAAVEEIKPAPVDPAPKKQAASNVVKLDKKTKAKIDKVVGDDAKKRDCVIAVLGGMPKREAERKFGISARAIGRLIDKVAA